MDELSKANLKVWELEKRIEQLEAIEKRHQEMNGELREELKQKEQLKDSQEHLKDFLHEVYQELMRSDWDTIQLKKEIYKLEKELEELETVYQSIVLSNNAKGFQNIELKKEKKELEKELELMKLSEKYYIERLKKCEGEK